MGDSLYSEDETDSQPPARPPGSPQMTENHGSPQSLFRPSAMAKIRSPEQLDALLPITSPVGWLALIAIGIALAGAMIWACTGTIMRTAVGHGIIVRDSNVGIIEVSGKGVGTVLDVLVEQGDVVRVGQDHRPSGS